jgi:TolB-like protein/Tfp pilus assembly protein PilF
MKKLESIDFDLSDYKITLQFHDSRDPLVVHFDTPSRRFYFSVIALIAHEMKNKDQPDFIYIRRYQNLLQRLDQGLSGKHASKNVEGMWAKIKMAWRHRLSDLEAATLFKILDRDLIPPYEKGGKYRYECPDDQCDIWTSLFGYDENNTWRFSFAGDSAVVDYNALSLSLGQLKDNAAWKAFLDRLSIESKIDSVPKKNAPTTQPRSTFALVSTFVVLAAILSTWFLFRHQTPQKEGLGLPDRPSIAVLPFTNLSDDPQQEYFTDGIVDGIITALSRVPKLFVIASNSTFTYKGKAVKVRQVSKDLGVRYVLEGSVAKVGNTVRINAQLIDAFTGHHLWAQHFDRNLSDIFAVQDEIIKKIITAMQVELTEGEQIKASARGTDNLEAYLKHLQALYKISKFDIENNASAKQLAEEAIALDPKYAMAHRDLAIAHRMDVWLGTSKFPKHSMDKCVELLRKALTLDPNYADAYSSLAFSLSMAGKHLKAVSTAEHAVALNPNSANAHAILGNTLRFSGRSEDAILEYKKAIRLNPIPPAYYLFGLGHAYCLTGQYEKAIKWCKKAILVAPDAYLPHLTMTVVYSMAGKDKEARASAAEVLRTNPKYSLSKHERRATIVGKEEYFRALRKAGLK